MSDRLISEGRARLQAASGPWKLTPPPPKAAWHENYWSVGTEADGLLERATLDGKRGEADAELIVWARNNLAALLDALEEAESDRDYYQALYYATDGR